MIPTNLITGFLGVGKTTLIRAMLRAKPVHLRWAIIVNEFGEVPIDGALLSEDAPDEVSIREIDGGCVCCTTAPFFHAALYMLLRDEKPDRVLIETTGLGHPARMLDALRMPSYADKIHLGPTICVVAPSDFAEREFRAGPVFLDQMHLADVLVLNKCDEASPELQAEFLQWGQALDPPKLLVTTTQQGQFNLAWLNLEGAAVRTALFPEAHAHHHVNDNAVSLRPPPKPGNPLCLPSEGQGQRACGWIFATGDVFDTTKLIAYLDGLDGVTRLKGLFHTENEWISVNRAGAKATITPTNYRRDSRVEIFEGTMPLDWSTIEAGLKRCLR